MNGPAVMFCAFVAIAVSSPSALGNTPMCAPQTTTAEAIPRRAQRRVVFGNDEPLGDLIAFGFFGVLERDNVEPGNVELQQQPDAQGGDPAGPRPHDRFHRETRGAGSMPTQNAIRIITLRE